MGDVAPYDTIHLFDSQNNSNSYVRCYYVHIQTLDKTTNNNKYKIQSKYENEMTKQRYSIHGCMCLPRYRYQSNEILSLCNEQPGRFRENFHVFALSLCFYRIVCVLCVCVCVFNVFFFGFSLLCQNRIEFPSILISVATLVICNKINQLFFSEFYDGKSYC